ncbi:MAG: acyltransferase [Verrucomicrobiae bacterium]|nr:acyltransferase [Verrucomicrobiae bacterium]
MKRIFGLDFARTLAIGLVVLAHAHQGSHDLGIYGVELFFALSGFLIGGILFRCVPVDEKWCFAGVANFWKRRWWRTLPAYYLFLLVSVVFHGLRGEAPEGGWGDLLSYLVFVPNLLSPNEVFYDVSWSLCVEEAFYLLFPLVVLGVHRIFGSRQSAFLWALLAFVLIPPVLREWSFQGWPAEQARVMTLPRLDAVAFGVAMAVSQQTLRFTQRQRAALAGVGSMILLVTVIAHLASRPLEEAEGFFRWGLLAMPLGFSLLMPLLGDWTNLPRWAERIRPAVTSISLWSYSIYLSHHMVLLAMASGVAQYSDSPVVKLIGKLVALILVLVLSRWIYVNFESRWTRRRPPEKHFSESIRERLPSAEIG